MADKLEIYNEALLKLGEREIASLSENREPRRVLDRLWTKGVTLCLEQGMWDFAMRTMQIDASDSVTPDFGYTNAFPKPTDWIRTARISADERFSMTLEDYADEVGYWWADVDPIYVSVVSSDPSYGFDLGLWPETFAEYVACHLARQACKRISNSKTDFDDLVTEERKARADALAKDAVNDPVRFMQTGTWVRSRSFGRASWVNQRYLRG